MLYIVSAGAKNLNSLEFFKISFWKYRSSISDEPELKTNKRTFLF